MTPPPDEPLRDEARGYELHLDADERAFLGLVRPEPSWNGGDRPGWQMLSELGRIHRLQPRLHRALEAGRIPAPAPQAVAERWRRSYYSALADSMALLRQRDLAVRTLAGEGVVPMVVKGGALAGTLYDDPALRPMEDLDLLLPASGEERFRELRGRLAEAGVDWERLEAEEDHHDLTMDGTFRVDVERLWSDSVPSPFAGGAGRVPAPEDQLLLVCISCCRNSFWKLTTLLDAAEMIHRAGDRLDWDTIVLRARGWELAVALDTLLALTGMLFDVHGPAAVRSRLRPGSARRGIIADLLASYRLHAGGGLESVNIPRPIGAFALKYAVSTPRVLSRQARTMLLPGWRWMRSHYPNAGRLELVLRSVAHPFVVAGLAARLALRRRDAP